MELRSHSSVSCHLVAIHGTLAQDEGNVLKFIIDVYLHITFLCTESGSSFIIHRSRTLHVAFLLLVARKNKT
jgi:hypothetical protein